MRKTAKFMDYSKYVICRIIAFLLAFIMLTFVGCSSDTTEKNLEKSYNKLLKDNTNGVTLDPLDSSSSSGLYNYKGYAQSERDALLKKILTTPNTLDIYDVKGNVYYVSQKGNDANDGKTPENAIQSIAAVASLPLEPNDAVLFERNSVFRLDTAFNCRKGIIYGSYGEGRKPMFLGSPINFADENWKPSEKKNVWKMSYMYYYPAGVFFNEGEECGYMKNSLSELSRNTDFYYDEAVATFYVYCDKGNPNEVWDSIEISQSNTCFLINSHNDHITVDNISLRYMGWGGVFGIYNNHYITVTNCEIGFTGGRSNGQEDNVRLGNGICTWSGGHDLKFDNNWIYQTWDSGVSPQGAEGHDVMDYYNISISGNLFEYNNADIELWEAGKDALGENPSWFSNWRMDNNIHRFTSLGWGTREDDKCGIRGIDAVHYGKFRDHNIKAPFTWSNNIIDCPGRMIFKFTSENKRDYDAWERKGNTYYIKQSMRTLDSLTFRFHWKEDNTRVEYHTAVNKEETLAAFKEFEPDATVYWYE